MNGDNGCRDCGCDVGDPGDQEQVVASVTQSTYDVCRGHTWEQRMYCVTCDQNGVLCHAETIYRGDALCREHAIMRREMIVHGTNPKPREVEEAVVVAEEVPGSLLTAAGHMG